MNDEQVSRNQVRTMLRRCSLVLSLLLVGGCAPHVTFGLGGNGGADGFGGGGNSGGFGASGGLGGVGMAGSGGSAGSGGAVCIPGSQLACYTGLPNTEGIGPCVGGIETCLPSGMGYGPCQGEVTPTAEDCATLTDENCDGSGQCGGSPVASMAWGGSDDDHGYGLALDFAHTLYVTGSFQATVDFGGGPLVSEGGNDVFLLQFDPGYNLIWSKPFGTTYDLEWGQRVATDAAGNIFLSGKYEEYGPFNPLPIDFGCGASSIGVLGSGSFLAKLDPDGSCLWDQNLEWTSCCGSAVRSLAVDSLDDPVVGITIYTIDDPYSMAMKLNGQSGALFWSYSFMDWNYDSYGSHVIDDADNVIMTVTTWDVSLSLQPLNVDIRKLDPAGSLLWNVNFGSPIDEKGGTGSAIDLDPTGNMVVTGVSKGDLNFGGGILPEGIFVVKFDASGNHLWSKAIAAPWWYAYPTSMAIDGAGNIVMAGGMDQPMDLGGGLLAGSAFFAKFDANGTHLWSTGFSNVSISQVMVDIGGNSILTGSFTGTVDFGMGPITSNGGTDVFVTVFGP